MTTYDSYTKSLLHFDGVDGSTVFTDEIGLSWTPGGSAQLDTAYKQFGASSALFSGSDWIETPNTSDLDFGSGDFTIDFRADTYGLTSGTDYYLFGKTDSTRSAAGSSFYAVYRYYSPGIPQLYFYWSNGSTWSYIYYDVGGSFGSFNHIVFTRGGGNLFYYNQGSSPAFTAISGAINTSTAKFSIGRSGESTTTPFKGWIDEFRVSKGIARYGTSGASFTPPLFAYGQEFTPRVMIFSGE